MSCMAYRSNFNTLLYLIRNLLEKQSKGNPKMHR